MLGAIYGDKAGSIYEYDQYNGVHPVTIRDDLILEESFYSDDTIETIPIAE